MASEWPACIKTQADLIGVLIECWLPIARTHSHPNTGVNYAAAPKEWDKQQWEKPTYKNTTAPAKQPYTGATDKKVSAKCTKCSRWHEKNGSCPPPKTVDKTVDGKEVPPTKPSSGKGDGKVGGG